MKNSTGLSSVPSDHLVPFTDQLRLAVAAYLARFKGASRYHRVRPALLPGLVRRARPEPVGWPQPGLVANDPRWETGSGTDGSD
jgi:hypothetical protein